VRATALRSSAARPRARPARASPAPAHFALSSQLDSPSLLATAPGNIAKAILRQVTAVLRVDNEQRKQFLASGGLKLVQTLVISAGGPSGHGAGRPTPAAASDPELVELVNDVNMCFPAEVVSYCREFARARAHAHAHAHALTRALRPNLRRTHRARLPAPPQRAHPRGGQGGVRRRPEGLDRRPGLQVGGLGGAVA
jgi:hypothetical protein